MAQRTGRSRAFVAKQRKQQIWLVVVLVALFGLIVGGIWWLTGSKIPKEISVQEAYQKYQDGALILDVRTPEEWSDFHVPNTMLIPLDELPNRLSEIPRDREIVVVCRSGNRSQLGRDVLLKAGFIKVTSMQGGLNAWREAGYPIE